MIPGVLFDPGPDYRGRVFKDFYPTRDPMSGPGWYVFGRCYEPWTILKLCARPDVKPRRHPHYNIRVQRGWRLLRDAQAVADQLNGGR